jgi:hypothetical protein
VQCQGATSFVSFLIMTNIFLSRPTWVPPEYQEGLNNFLEFLAAQGLNPRTIGTTDKPLKSPMEEVIDLMKICKGAIVLGYPQIVATAGSVKSRSISDRVELATEWNHMETALAVASHLPLIMIHDTLVSRGVFERGAVNGFLYKVDLKNPAWPLSTDITGAISAWKPKVSGFTTATMVGISAVAPKKLGTKYVTVGTYDGVNISKDILAKIVLGETSDPGISAFIGRVHGGEPYCPKCSTPLSTTHASWMADGVQTGYTCEHCLTLVEGDYDKYSREVKAEVRRNYTTFYQKYQEEINKMTGNRQTDFVVE